VNSPFKDKSGDLKKDTCFINVVCWSQIAEVCNQYLTKGSGVFVEGRLQSRSWQDSEGRKRNVIEVRARRVQFLPKGTKPPQDKGIDLGEEPAEVMGSGEELGEAI